MLSHVLSWLEMASKAYVIIANVHLLQLESLAKPVPDGIKKNQGGGGRGGKIIRQT